MLLHSVVKFGGHRRPYIRAPPLLCASPRSQHQHPVEEILARTETKRLMEINTPQSQFISLYSIPNATFSAG